jgi:hypothetical protein
VVIKQLSFICAYLRSSAVPAAFAVPSFLRGEGLMESLLPVMTLMDGDKAGRHPAWARLRRISSSLALLGPLAHGDLEGCVGGDAKLLGNDLYGSP